MTLGLIISQPLEARPYHRGRHGRHQLKKSARTALTDHEGMRIRASLGHGLEAIAWRLWAEVEKHRHRIRLTASAPLRRVIPRRSAIRQREAFLGPELP